MSYILLQRDMDRRLITSQYIGNCLTNLFYRSTEEMFSMADESCSSNPAMVRRKKIAISIIFSLPEKEEAQRNFQDFFFSHFPLFESHMNKLKYAIEKVQNTSLA